MTQVSYEPSPSAAIVGVNQALQVDQLKNLKTTSPALAVRTITAGTITYVGQAPVGTATSAALWQIQRIDTATGTVVTWADGNDRYDNVWDDYATITYS